MKKNKISKNWINKQKRDIYVRQSKLEGYRSRAVYKLQEIQTKFKVINNGMSIVDLGAAPGSWSEFISRKFKNIKLVAIDLKELDKIENVIHIKGDFTDEITQKKIKKIFDDKIGFLSLKSLWDQVLMKLLIALRRILKSFMSINLHQAEKSPKKILLSVKI